MKLLELIVNKVKREDIPSKGKFFVQDSYDIGRLWWNTEKPMRYETKDGWYSPVNENEGSSVGGDYFDEAAVDADDKVVTREELMRAYDLVEQGYTLWFGGECPVEDGTEVEIWLRDYSDPELYLAGTILWGHYDISEDIIAYKLVEQPTSEEKLSLPTYYCEEKLQDTTLDIWTSQSGDLCVNLTSFGMNNEIVMSPITALQFANDLSSLALKIMEKEND